MRHKIGVQFQWDDPEVVRFCQLVQPVAAMAIEVDKAGFLSQVRPHVEQLVWRHWPNRAWADNPEVQAAQTVDHIRARVGHLIQAGLVTMVTDNNEYVYEHNTHLHVLADRYMSSVVVLAEAELGVGVAVGNLNTGHFWDGSGASVSVAAAFPRTLEVLSGSRKSCLAIHEYDWPTLDRSFAETGEYWLCGRFQRIMEPVLERWPDVRCAITELGADSGVVETGPHKGWRQTRESYQEAIDLFAGAHGLEWIDALYRKYEWLWFALIFGCGMGPDWSGFDISGTEVADKVALFPGVDIPLPPPTNGGNDMDVCDLEGHLLTGAAAQDKIAYHGLTITQPPGLVAGQKVLRLVKLEEREGPACFIFTVLQEDGTPWAGVETAWAWTDDMGDANDIELPYATDWQAQADIGVTNENGNVGPGFGQTGWYHDPYKPGPGRAWIRHAEYWSTRLTGIGMLGMTNHRTMYGTWKPVVVTGGEEPEPPASSNLGDRIRVCRDELTSIASEVDKLGQVTKVKLVMADGSEVEFKPSLSVASRIATALVAIFRR